MLRAGFIVFGFVILIASFGVRADQSDPRLERLFGDLAKAEYLSDARDVERKIWNLWEMPAEREARIPFSVGVNFMGEGLLEAARDSFSEAIAIAPDFAEAYNKRATVLYYMGDLEGSIADIQKTLALEPRHFGAMSGMAMISRDLGREEAALEMLIRIKEIYPAMQGIDERIDLMEAVVQRERI